MDMSKLAKAIKPMIKNALINGGGYLGSAGASALGVPGSSNAMNGVGRALGARISKLIGSGDYAVNDVSVNSLMKPRGMNASASFGTSLNALRIRHREYIGDVQTASMTGIFSVNSYPINPGNSNSFPFLSNIASNYDNYVFHGLVYEFVSTTAGTSSGAMGSIILSSDYNPNATPYASKHIMENSGLAVSARLDCNAMYGIECAPSQIPSEGYMVRTSASSDLIGQDQGVFQVATAPSTAFPANAVVGELWVTYDVELRRPQLSPNRYGYACLNGSSYTAALPLGASTTKSLAYGCAQGINIVSGTQLQLPQTNTGDIFKIDVSWSGSSNAILAYPSVTGTGCTVLQNFQLPNAGISSNSGTLVLYVSITATDPAIPTLTFGTTSTLPTTIATCTIWATCVGAGLTVAQL